MEGELKKKGLGVHAIPLCIFIELYIHKYKYIVNIYKCMYNILVINKLYKIIII